jgi:hypothetical protein
MGPSNVGWWAAGCVGADCHADGEGRSDGFSLLLCWLFLFLFIVVSMCGVSCSLQDGRWLFFYSCSLLLPCRVSPAYCGRGSGEKTNKQKTEKKEKKDMKKKPMLI